MIVHNKGSLLAGILHRNSGVSIIERIRILNEKSIIMTYGYRFTSNLRTRYHRNAILVFQSGSRLIRHIEICLYAFLIGRLGDYTVIDCLCSFR